MLTQTSKGHSDWSAWQTLCSLRNLAYSAAKFTAERLLLMWSCFWNRSPSRPPRCVWILWTTVFFQGFVTREFNLRHRYSRQWVALWATRRGTTRALISVEALMLEHHLIDSSVCGVGVGGPVHDKENKNGQRPQQRQQTTAYWLPRVVLLSAARPKKYPVTLWHLQNLTPRDFSIWRKTRRFRATIRETLGKRQGVASPSKKNLISGRICTVDEWPVGAENHKGKKPRTIYVMTRGVYSADIYFSAYIFLV